MDIFEAIRTFHTPWLMPSSSFLSPQQKQQQKVDFQQRQEAESVCRRQETYLPFTTREGCAIALAAIELFDVGVERRFAFIPSIILENLAKSVPGALHGLYPRLIERQVFWGDGEIYREADPETRDLLLALLETDLQDGPKHHDLLCALAWIGDEKVREQFNRWHHTSPAWQTAGGYSLQQYARHAGWELTEEGKRHDLCFHLCYDLIAIDATPTAELHGPVAVIAPREDHCPWCGRPLVTLFELHLQDHRLSFLSVQREKLLLPICINCSLQEQVFFDVANDGTSHWSEDNGNPSRHLELYEDDLLPPWPQQKLMLGEKRKTPFINGGSHVGGYPTWVQYPDYPHCPTCQQTMLFVGQLKPAADCGAPSFIEGLVYAFLCPPCGKATVAYQQT